MRAIFLSAAALVLAPAGWLRAAEAVDYLRDVKPLLAARCSACHGALQQKGGLRLDTAMLVREGGNSGPAVVPGKTDRRTLLEAVGHAGKLQMPPPRALADRAILALTLSRLTGLGRDEIFKEASDLARAIAGHLDVLSSRDKIMAYAGAYFDFIASNPIYPKLMQREMMRAREGHSEHIDRLVKTYFQPVYRRLGELLKKGMAEGEFRNVNPAHFVSSMVAMIVFYFSSAPVMQKIVHFNPLTPQRIAERRAAVLDFISAALFAPGAGTGLEVRGSGVRK